MPNIRKNNLVTGQETSQRRTFLKQAVGGVACLKMLGDREVNASPSAAVSLPLIQIGDKQVTRMIAGGNPLGGVAHSVKKLSMHMRNYFTVERITEFLIHCHRHGINTFQSHYSESVGDGLKAARDRGANLQWICLTREDLIEKALPLQPIAVVPNGVWSDQRFLDGEQEKVRDFVKKIHDRGVAAGISTHNPEVLARLEDLDWGNDFYMTCFYYLSRSKEKIRKMLGEQCLGGLYLQDDPKRMTEQIRKASKPCLAFKILGAGRLCGSPEAVEKAFAYAYSNIKAKDGVIVGMYPVFTDEVQEDVGYARKYSRLS